jgi:hypothetical protein
LARWTKGNERSRPVDAAHWAPLTEVMGYVPVIRRRPGQGAAGWGAVVKGTAVIMGASLGTFSLLTAAAAQTTTTPSAKIPGSTYTYGPRPPAPACTRRQVRLSVSLPPGDYYGGSPVPFKVQIANLSPTACSITALPPPSGLTTELVYVRIFDANGRRVLVPGGPPGLRARMLPQSLKAHQVFSYACTWNGRTWLAVGVSRSSGPLGAPAPAGRYTAEALLARPSAQTGALHFVLKGR